jgi:hypothetical protein
MIAIQLKLILNLNIYQGFTHEYNLWQNYIFLKKSHQPKNGDESTKITMFLKVNSIIKVYY